MSATSVRGLIIGLYAGRSETRWPGRPPSAIAKRPVEDGAEIGPEGLLIDEQADRTVHGGPDKAIHHYASEHMEFWRTRFPSQAGQFRPCCFGENLSTSGLTEESLCLGDILTLGSARVQVSQGRQPCWKLNAHTGIEEMAQQFQITGRTGWYYRVLTPGMVKAGDRMELLDRPQPQWPLRRLITARFNPQLSTDEAAELAGLTVLSASWRDAFARKARPSTNNAAD